MQLHQLRCLLALARSGFNVTGAAERLFKSQPGVSKQLRLLEEELGVPLFERAGRQLTGLTPAGRAVLELAENTLAIGPMGEVLIAAEKCTLCTACVRICPTEALSLPGTTLQLAFTEERCLQCGLCANVCPEKAVTLVPRLLTSRAARRAPRVVAEAEPFACTGCGKQFATRAMIERSRAMMANHPMFQGEQARLMTLCPDCRQKTMAGVPISHLQ